MVFRSDQDPILLPLTRRGSSPETREAALRAVLSEHAAPRIATLTTAAVRRGLLVPEDASDLGNEVHLRLLMRLRQLIADSTDGGILDFGDYVFVVFRHALEDHRRRVDPARARLEYRVRYALTHSRGLAVWGPPPSTCGLVEWQGRTDRVPAPRLRWHDPADDARTLRTLVEAVLRAAGAPVSVPDLVGAVAVAAGLPEDRFVPLAALRDLEAATTPASDLLSQREYLDRIWAELEQLPLRQRRAVLLNGRLDNGDSIARALVDVGVVGLRRLASALEMPVERLLADWDRLPFKDSAIAELLGATRQQVINLRKAARDRLARRVGRRRRAVQEGM